MEHVHFFLNGQLHDFPYLYFLFLFIKEKVSHSALLRGLLRCSPAVPSLNNLHEGTAPSLNNLLRDGAALKEFLLGGRRI